MRIAICDDDNRINDLIEDYIKISIGKPGIIDKPGFNEVIKIDKISSAFELYEYIENVQDALDVIFLDIVLGRDNGIELGAKLQEKQKNVRIIFITGYINYVESIFHIVPFGLLLKPITQERVSNILLKAIKSLDNNKGSYVTFKNHHGLSTVALKDIVYVESQGRYLEIHCGQADTLRVIMTMNEVEKMLNDDFIRCHRSYFINVRKIKKLSKKYASLDNGNEVPVSAGNYQQVYDKFISSLEERW